MKKLVLVLIGAAALGCGGSATFTESEEYYMGRGVAALAIEKDKLWSDEKIEEYISLVGLTVALESDRPDTFKGYTFAVLNTDEINAFAAPSGFIFLTKGALRSMNSEDELAGVLAHEIAHVCLRHPELAANRAAQDSGLMDKAKAMGKLAGAGAAIAGFFGQRQASSYLEMAKEGVPMMGKTIGENLKTFKKGYGRQEELAADAMGVDFVTRKGVGYDPNAFRAFISRLPQKADSYGSHPGLEGRLQAIDDEIKKHKAAPADAGRTKRFLAMKAGLGQ